MKELRNGEQVPSRIYYYLLDWNDHYMKVEMWNQFEKESLHELTKSEIYILFKIATERDLSLI